MIEIEKIIQDILLTELGLPVDYGTAKGKIIPSIYIVSPLISLGNTDLLQIGIQSFGARFSSVQTRTEEINGVFTEIQEAVVDDNFQIDLYSKNNDARTRRYEVLLALNSIYSQQQQDKYTFKLFNIPSSFVNTSLAEGSALINRYSITIATQYLRVKSKPVEYYENYTGDVYTELIKENIVVN